MVDSFELSWGSLEQTVQAGILPWDITVQVDTIDLDTQKTVQASIIPWDITVQVNTIEV